MIWVLITRDLKDSNAFMNYLAVSIIIFVFLIVITYFDDSSHQFEFPVQSPSLIETTLHCIVLNSYI